MSNQMKSDPSSPCHSAVRVQRQTRFSRIRTVRDAWSEAIQSERRIIAQQMQANLASLLPQLTLKTQLLRPRKYTYVNVKRGDR